MLCCAAWTFAQSRRRVARAEVLTQHSILHLNTTSSSGCSPWADRLDEPRCGRRLALHGASQGVASAPRARHLRAQLRVPHVVGSRVLGTLRAAELLDGGGGGGLVDKDRSGPAACANRRATSARDRRCDSLGPRRAAGTAGDRGGGALIRASSRARSHATSRCTAAAPAREPRGRRGAHLVVEAARTARRGAARPRPAPVQRRPRRRRRAGLGGRGRRPSRPTTGRARSSG